MNPLSDPSGAARAPQTTDELVARVKRALRDFDRQGTKLAGSGSRLREILWPEEVELVENAPEWLGALAQAVEDQQRAVEWRDSVLGKLKTFPEFAETVWGGEKGNEGWGWAFEFIGWLYRDHTRLEAEVARIRADGQRLRTALKPFEPAKVAPHLDAADADAAVDWVCTIADLRRVRDALSSGLPSGDAP